MAAASGVGTCMIQLCKMAGVDTIAISSSPTKLEKCMELGSFSSVNYKQYPFYSDVVTLITDGEGVDVIFDPILGTFFNCNLKCLGYDSRWVIYDAMGGEMKDVPQNLMKLLGKRASIMTSSLRDKTNAYKRGLIE